MSNKHTQVVDFTNPHSHKITSATTSAVTMSNKQSSVEQELTEWDDNVKSFVKEKQMTKEAQKEFLEEYDSHLFRGGLNDVEWFYNELYGGNK